MLTNIIFVTLTVLIWSAADLAEAQQVKKIPHIGYLTGTFASATPGRRDVFRQGLRELGYVEGQNLILVQRFADGKLERLPELAEELVRLNVDIIVTAGLGPTRAAKAATTTIPIVMTNEGDPVGAGLVKSLARPGGNITGLSTLAPELNGKRLEILKEMVPKLSRVAVFRTSTQPGIAQILKELDIAAKALDIRLQYLDVLEHKHISRTFQAATKERAGGALFIVAGAVVNEQRAQIAALAVKSRLPVMYTGRAYVESGGLVTYGINTEDLDRRAATYVDKILKGQKPGDLPIEQPMKFHFIINLRAAKGIDLTIPPNVLVRADRVIR